MRSLEKLTKKELIDHVEDLENLLERGKAYKEKVCRVLDYLDSMIQQNHDLLIGSETGPETLVGTAIARQLKAVRSSFKLLE